MASNTVVKEIRIRATTDGVTEATRSLRDLGQATDATAKVTETAGRRTLAVEGAYKRLVSQLDETARASQQMERAQRTLDRAFEQSIIDTTQYARAMDMLNAKYDAATIAAQRDAQAVSALRAQIDPLTVAQSRLNTEIAEYAGLASRGAITAQEFAKAQAMAQKTFDQTTASIRRQNGAIADNDDSARFRRQNLTYQLFDVGTTLQGGMNPATIAMQQGPQIAQLYAGNGGVNAALKDTLGLLGSVAARFAPIGIAAGGAALAVHDLQGEIEKATGVAVTFGDVAKAVFQVIGGYIMDGIQPAVDWIAPYFTQAWGLVQDVTGIAFNGVVAAVLTAIETIKFASGALPTAFRIAGEGAANAFIAGINYMVEQSLTGINAVIEAINFVTQAGDSGLSKFDPKAYEIAPVDLGGVNDLSERFEKLQTTLGEINQADYLGDFKKDLSDQAVKNAADRLAEVEKKAKGAGRGLSEADKEARAFADALKEIEQQAAAFEGKADGLLDKFFPGEAAKREAQELMTLLGQFGSRLDTFQRQAVEGEIAGLQTAAELGLRRLPDQARERGQESADALSETIGQELSDLFSQPYDSMSDFFDAVIDKLAQVGQHFADLGWERLVGQFTGMSTGGTRAPSYGGANDNVPTSQDVQRRLADNMEKTSRSALDVARQFDGLNERADSGKLNTFMQAAGTWRGLSADSTAWCAAFANAAIMEAGGQGTGSNLASSFMNWGSATNAPKPGDIVVLKPQSRGASGHVGFVAGFGDGSVQVFGGNQSNGANTKSFGMDQVAGFRTGGDVRVLAKGVEDGTIAASNKLGIAPVATGAGGQQGGFFQNGGMDVLGAGAGAFAQGFQSGSPFGGGISGVMSGYGAGPAVSSALGVSGAMGGILGAVGGGILGVIGGFFGKKSREKAERKAAQKELEKQMGAIQEMLDYASGTVAGGINKAVREFRDETAKAIELANKAGDKALKKRLKASIGELEARLIKDFKDAYEGTIEGLNLGLGIDNPFKQGFDAVKSLREELLAFVDDAKTAGLALDEAINGASGKAGSAANSNNLNEYQARDLINRHQRGEDISGFADATWSGRGPFSGNKDNAGPNAVYMEQLNRAMETARSQALAKAKDAAEGAAEAERQLSDARKAAINQALSVLTGPTELTDIAQEMMELRGKAAALPDVLKDLGLTSEQAAQRIEESLGQAIAKIRDTFTKDLIDQIDDLDGKGYLPEFRDLFKSIEDMMSDAKLIGADTALVDAFFKKSAQSIVDGSQLAGSAFDALIAQFPQLAGVVRQYYAILARSAEETRRANQEYLSGRLTVAINERASAESDLLSAYNTAKDRLEGLQSRIKDFLADIRLNDNSPLSGQDQFREAQKAYQETLAKANAGDEDAQEKLVSVSQDYLNEARAYYASSEAYQAVWDEINRTLDGASTKAQSQLDVMKSQVSRLIDINDSTLTVAQAVAKVEAAVREVAKAEGALNGARDWGVNASFNKALTDALSKAGLNYTGNFGAGAFTQWQGGLSTTDLDRVQQIINGLGGIPTTQPAQSLGANPVRNTSIVSGLSGAGLNYSGGFGAGQFSAWVQSLPPAQKAIADAIANQYAGIGYAQGGYTGAGGINEIAGLAHKGEVYFSQADVSRWGGPAQVENLRRAGPQVSNDNRVVAAIDRLTEENRALREEVQSLKAVTAQGALTVAGKVDEGNGIAREQAGVAKRRASA